jgi:hypothetical protein
MKDLVNMNFHNRRDIIGYDWKNYDFNNGRYKTRNHVNYIIKTNEPQPKFFKLRFTDFYSVDGLKIIFKVVTGDDGKLQFALDRGSTKKEDIEGITIDKLEERFDKGHGMIPVGKFVLSVMNSSIDLIMPELKKDMIG